MRLTKGFEVEIYTGTAAGEIVGFSDQVVTALPNFAREPDRRNVEYITPPLLRYEHLLCELVRPRRRLRQFLAQQGPYTLLPGSTLALGGTDRFERSDPSNPYHSFIERTYGTTVVTASIHINIGLDSPEQIFRACRLLRAEAPLYLALSAASPFLNGEITGAHSTRWKVFPKTPTQVPFFQGLDHFVQWTQQQLALGTMQNVRHLWDSVRPNGPDRPQHLNRVEVRICDMVSDPLVLLAITALIEARLLQMLAEPEACDPLVSSRFTPDELVQLTTENEQAAATNSLEATLTDWHTGRDVNAAAWIEEQMTTAWRRAYPLGFSCFLTPLQKVLRQGNEAQRWLEQTRQGKSPAQVYRQAIQELQALEAGLEEALCQTMFVES